MIDLCFVLFLVCLYVCVCECLLQNNMRKYTSINIHSRTKSLETVATRVVTGIRYWIILFCERYRLAGVGRRG